MKCQNCMRNEANINYVQSINGVRSEVHLCTECASKMGINVLNNAFNSFGSIFEEDPFFGTINQMPKMNLGSTPRIAQKEDDGKEIDGLLKRVTKTEDKPKKISNKAELETELKRAIAEEDYERAEKIKKQMEEGD